MVEALSGGRWQGSSTAEATPTKSNSNFGSWTTTGSQVTESSNVISFDITTRISTHICSQDLGSALSDDKWVLRGKLNYTTLTGGGGSTVYLEVGIGSSATATMVNDGVNLDFIGLQQRLANDANGWGLVGYDSSDSLDNPESPEMDTDPNTSTTYYFEIKRTADNAMSIGLYDSSSYDTLITGIPIETKTIATSITGLRYLRISNAQVGSETSTGNVIEGTISDLKVWNNTTSTTEDEKDSLTNVPTNTRYEETDTRKIYRRAAGNATVETLNATNGTTNWSADTSKLTKSGNTITFSATGASNDEEIYYDLTSTSDDKWTLRFKADFTSIGAGTNATHQQLQFGIFDATNPSGNASGDVIMFYLSSAGNVSNAVNGVNGGTSDITSTNNTPIASSGSAVTYYIELQRTSSSAIQAKVFSDEYDTQVGSTLSKTGLSGITGLRYLMVRLWGESGAGNGAVGSVTDMKFYNDTTTPLSARWIERNTAT